MSVSCVENVKVAKDKSDRMVSPDIARAIAIIMVVWGHLIQILYTPQVSNILGDVLIYRLIYTVHMPLFMLISGYFYYSGNNKYSFAEMSKKRIIGILVPILVWNTIHYIINLLFSVIYKSESVLSVKEYAYELLEGYWFLWAILLFSIVMSLAHCVNNKYIRIICYFCFSIAFLLSPCRWPIITIYPFFLLGYLYSYLCKISKKDWLSSKYVAVISGLIYVFALLIYIKKMEPVGNSEIKHLLEVLLELKSDFDFTKLLEALESISMYYILGFFGSIFILSIIKIICNKRKTSLAITLFSQIGAYSLQIYILQRIIFEQIISRVYQAHFIECSRDFLMTNMLIVTTGITFVIATIASIFITLWMKRIKDNKVVHFIFGR